MSSQPEVSIIMPVYNEELYLAECLESIIKQKFKNWELIAVDDFSTDNSFNILGQFAKKDDRIRIYSNTQKGIIPALFLAFKSSRGIMISRMDADDIMPVGKLHTLHKKLSKEGPGNIVSGKVKYFSDDQLKGGFLKYEKWINELAYYPNIYKECTLPSACWMAFRSDLVSINAFTESQYPEDYDLLFKFYENGLRIHGIEEVLHLWRDHPKRASRNDPNYADQNFFPLKTSYFVKIDHDASKELFLWGAGRKGKALALQLKKRGLTFRWLTQNEKKTGKHIYGIIMEDTEALRTDVEKQVIIAISDQTFNENKSHIIDAIHHPANTYFNFC